MELQKGICFLCRNSKVISSSLAEKAFKVICSLFSETVLNIAELTTLQSTLTCCPICFHKLLIVECTSENIKTYNLGVECRNKCSLCKNGKVSFEIKDWPHFNKISSGLLSEDIYYVICLDCLFYLDTRFEIKTKLFTKYPHLKVQSTNIQDNGEKRKSRDLSNVLSQSTDILENEERTADIDIINISAKTDRQPLKQKSFISESLKNLKPLRYSKTLRRREIVKSDTKFLNQIPYVLLKTFNFSYKGSIKNNLEVDDTEISSKTVRKENYNADNFKYISQLKPDQLTLNKTIKPRRFYPKSIKIKRELNKVYIVKSLVVNLTKINMLNVKPQKYKPNLRIDKLINKFTVLQRPTITEIDEIVEENPKDVNNLLIETRNNFEVKAKRKCVFTEEENVDMESFENSKTNSGNEISKNLIENDAVNEIVNKQNKYIHFSEIGSNLSIPEIDVECEIQNKRLIEENADKCLNTDGVINPAVITEIGFKKSISKSECNITKRVNISEEYSIADNEKISTNHQIAEDKNIDVQGKEKLNCRRKSVVFDSDTETIREHENNVLKSDVDLTEGICGLKENEPKPLVKKKGANILVINLENTTGGNSSNISKNVNLKNDKETIVSSLLKINMFSNSETVNQIGSTVNQIDSTKNDKNDSLSNELKNLHKKAKSDDKIKVTAINVDNGSNLSTKNESRIKLDNTDKNIKMFETNNKVKDQDCKLPLNNNIRNNSNNDINLDIQKETESSSKKAKQLLHEYDKNESISDREKVGNTSLNETKNNITKLAFETEKDLENSEDSKKSERGNLSLIIEELDKVNLSLNNENKESDTGDSTTANESSKGNENSDSNSDQNEFEISEHDKNNINSILTDMFSQQEESTNNTLNESNTIEQDVSDDVNHKRKMSVEELNSNMDKKKKKVTFCEDYISNI